MPRTRLASLLALSLATLTLAACAAAPASAPATSVPAAEPVESVQPTPEPVVGEFGDDRPQEPLTGLIALNRSTDSAGNMAMFVLVTINPVTGDVGRNARLFTWDQCSDAYPSLDLWSAFFTRMSFDKDYWRVTATYRDPSDNSQHVGWIDGYTCEFTDVTAATSGGGSAFSAKVRHFSPKFDLDGNFYYLDEGTRQIMKVTTKTPSSPADAVAVDSWDEGYTAVSLATFPNGELGLSNPSGFGRIENITHGVGGHGRVDDWVNETTMLTTELGLTNIALSDATADAGSLIGSGTNSNRRYLLPDVKGRASFNPVASPDGSQVAFLSWLINAQDPPQYFVVPTQGGEPRLVTDQIGGSNPEGAIGIDYKTQLLDWR